MIRRPEGWEALRATQGIASIGSDMLSIVLSTIVFFVSGYFLKRRLAESSASYAISASLTDDPPTPQAPAGLEIDRKITDHAPRTIVV